MAYKKRTAGHLDIVGLFQAEAQSLLDATSRGELLHKTKNIRDSGAPLERRFRDIVSNRLPAHVELAHGYLFDVNSACTPQIDAMMLAASDNHPMMSVEGEGVYAPFTSARAIVEIKSSPRGVDDHLNQVKATTQSLRQMRQSLNERRPAGSVELRVPRIISVLFFAKLGTAKVAAFKKWLNANDIRDFPTYTVFLDKGRILTREHSMNALFEMDGQGAIGFDDPKNPGNLSLCGPEIEDERIQGRTLAWVYFMLLHHASNVGAIGNPIRAFTADATQRFAIIPRKSFDTLATWE